MRLTVASALAAFLVTLAAPLVPAAPLGTAFTYQGRLNNDGTAANGSYDLRCVVYDAPANGNAVGATLTNAATGITNGLFIVTLDFGGGVFNGDTRWLEIAVRTNGGGAFIPLSPRQSLAPAPIDRPKLRTRCASCGVMQVLPPEISSPPRQAVDSLRRCEPRGSIG